MARKQVIVSDLTGTETDELEAVRVVIRRGSGISRPLALERSRLSCRTSATRRTSTSWR
jgi:hypothetical protein